MDNKILKTRDEIDKKYKWNLEAMYSSDQVWEEDFAKVSQLTEDFDKYRGHLTESASTLLAALKDSDKLNLTLEKVYVYSRMKLDEDNTVSKYQEMNGRCMTLIAKVGAEMSFFVPELIEAPEEKILGFIEEEPGLKLYEFSLKDTLKMKKHVLSKEEESIMAQLSEVTGSSRTVFTMLNNADMDFGYITDENGEKVQLTHGNYINYMESHDRKVREEAFNRTYETYKGQINTISTLYGTNVNDDVIHARIRLYSSARNMALSPNEIPEGVYDNLISVVHDYLPVLHRYIELRKKILGVDELKMYDVYVPLVKVPERKVPFDDAVKIMNEALKPLGDDYLEVVNKGIKDGWIDIYENKGKTSGAYSFGSYDSYPYILLNYTDRLQDVLTIIHEMGHSMHSYYTRTNQPPVYGDYSIFVAEVASTVNENLLLRYLLNKEEDVEMKKYLLNKYIEEFRATVFRQTMFAEFEAMAHRYVEEGGSLTSDWLCSTYDELNTLYFGPALTHDDMIQYEWARIPHFYNSFYVYQYATGFSAASAISHKILTEGEEAVKNYKNFLSMGSSAYPVDELKVAGVDISRKESIVEAMETFKSLVEELEELI